MNHTFSLHGSSIVVASLATHFVSWLERHAYSQVLLITDTSTRKYCLPTFLAQTGMPADTPVVEISPGETSKNLDTCQLLWRAMHDAQLDRHALVINLGGGVIGDMGGFCAATWKRGLAFIQIPTTLLSMTDAAIGGKLGIDFMGLKNVIGVIRQPQAVFVDPVFLKTLPDRERKSGLAEMIKHAAISGQLSADWLKPDTASDDSETWLHMLRASIEVKVKIVEEDPLEKGRRMLLNYGHTIGHAVESYFLDTENPLTHGEAVAIGMICENHLSRQPLGMDLEHLIRSQYTLPALPSEALPALWKLMLQDKKNASGNVRMALPDASPFSFFTQDLRPSDLEKALVYYNTRI